MPHHLSNLARDGRALLAIIAAAALLTALSVAALAWADDNAPARAEPSTGALVDSLGRTINAPEQPQRIAALAPQAAELLVDLGVTPALRPITPYETPEALRHIPTISVEHAAGPNLEQLAAARPDLIVISAVHAQFIPTMQRIMDAPVVAIDIRSSAELKRTVTLLAALTGSEARAQQRLDEIDTLIARADEGSAADRPRAFALFGAPAAFYAFLPSSYLGDLIDLAGGDLVAGGLEESQRFRGFSPIGLESIVAADPDLLLVVAHGGAEARVDALRKDPAWSGLRAVREGRVVALPERLFVTAAGAHFDEALALVRAALHEGDASR